MQKYVKIFLDFWGYTTADIILCQVRADGCQNVATDILHIDHRKMGGNPEKNVIENLMASCRNCHTLLDSEKLNRDEIRKENIERVERHRQC